MLLKDYISGLKEEHKSIFFSGIASDSKKVKKNNIFFAIKGTNENGNNFINDAIRKGASVIVSEKKFHKKKNNIVFLHVSNVRKLLSKISFKIAKVRPNRLIAVTGTNGKTSVSDFYYQILNLNNINVASIGTNGVKYKNKKKNLKNTTIDAIQLSLILKDLKKNKINNVVMEASSHGLDQNRLDGLLFDIGLFTNLSHDHLDYHKNMTRYFKSKLYLFDKLIKKKGNIITDATIPQKSVIKKICIKNDLKFNLILDEKRGIKLISHKFEDGKQILNIKFKGKIFNFNLNLIGKIQIKNLLMSILAAYKSGIKFKKIIKKLEKIKPVEGRLEKVGKIKNNSKVILDYAHTPEALQLALLNLKDQFPNSKINLVFGCGGNRDRKKRHKMGEIASKFSEKIFLTDDNPRYEKPSNIRNDIKKGIKHDNFYEIPNRKKAIQEAIMSLNTGDLVLVAGKGHEKIQDYGKKKFYFSDQKIILNSIKKKNNSLSENLKLNIIKELSGSKVIDKKKINNISINSKAIKKNDIFFAIKGKKFDGNKFVLEAIKKGSSLTIVNHVKKDYPLKKQIKVKNSLKFLTECSRKFRENINAKIISITGSCGKTTVKEMIGSILKDISNTTFSPKSFNNKYGVPLSLFNLKQNDDFGVFEVGMDKKGEIDNLTKILKPDLGIITNISYAHSKNFSNIKKIAEAKGEIINNIRRGGAIILNMDDEFYNYHKNLARKKNLEIITFSLKNNSASAVLTKIKKKNHIYELFMNLNDQIFSFYSNNVNENNLYNILATIVTIGYFANLKKLRKSIFLKFKIPNGRGDISKIRLNNKQFFLVDESYNSNPLSLKTAIQNFDRLKLKNSRKYLILGDMLELGKHSIKQHKLISKIINKTKIDKVFVIGNHIKETFKGLKISKKGKIFYNKLIIFDFINKNLRNNDYIMIKGSNSTGLHRITSKLKERNLNAL